MVSASQMLALATFLPFKKENWYNFNNFVFYNAG